MNFSLKITLLLLSNLLGSFSHAIIVNLMLVNEFLDIQKLSESLGSPFLEWFSPRVMLCWIVCALFSISGLFVGGVWRLFFLLSPATIPFLFGISLLFSI